MIRQTHLSAGTVAAVLLLAGCSSSGNPTSAASSALAAARSGASALASAANGLGSAVASAESAASSAFASIKGGLDAKTDIELGTVVTGSDGRSDVPITVTNHGTQSYRYTVQINFDDQSGNLVDTVIVNVPEVVAAGTAQAAARSNRNLPSPVTAKVGNAVRY
ncbi:hypothetical protein [Kitasatospora sp. MAP5-34]|uniref:hypothetical protein n=1 Tax=Kitasatospora sp. MAP5-34 TaxID=3035102 RepID=UPI002475D44B|nr:hypothetical protein [Kitasatospora sp. MAP5-34]MDH6574941.1 putative metal-binding protein [Kitasatospora sp. MAP5-34]